MTETTIDKVRAYKNGDKSAIEALLKQYEPLIKSYARNFGTREMEDAEQELRIALYSAVEQIDQVDMEAKVVNYLVKAVKSRFIYLYMVSIGKELNLKLLYWKIWILKCMKMRMRI